MRIKGRRKAYTSMERKERAESEAFFAVFLAPIVIIPVAILGSISAQPGANEQSATDAATSAVELLEANEDDFIYSRLAAEALSHDSGLGRPELTVVVTSATSAPTADAYCVTATVGEAVINYDSSTEEYTQTDDDEEFVCEATPEGWN